MGRGRGVYGRAGQGRRRIPVGAMEPTARPMDEAVKDSRQVTPMNRTNLHQAHSLLHSTPCMHKPGCTYAKAVDPQQDLRLKHCTKTLKC